MTTMAFVSLDDEVSSDDLEHSLVQDKRAGTSELIMSTQKKGLVPCRTRVDGIFIPGRLYVNSYINSGSSNAISIK